MGITVIQAPKQASTAKNPFVFRVYADPAWRSFASYKIGCWVAVEDPYRSSNMQQITTLKDGPSASDEVIFNLSALLESFLEPEPPEDLSLGFCKVAQKAARRVFITLQEYKNNSLTDAKSYPFLFVIRGYLSKFKGEDFWGWIQASRFLSHQPREKRVSQYQPEFLSLIITAKTSGTAKVKAKIIFEDGSESSSIDTGLSCSFKIYDLIQFSAGWKALGLENQISSQDATGWRVWLEDQSSGDPLSEEQVFSFKDCNCSGPERFFLLENSLGGWDTIRATGEASSRLQASKAQARRILSPLAGLEAELLSYNSELQEGAEQEVGFNSSEEQNWLRELFISEAVFRIGERGENSRAQGALIPILIDGGEVELYRDNIFLNTLKFSYKEAIISKGL